MSERDLRLLELLYEPSDRELTEEEITGRTELLWQQTRRSLILAPTTVLVSVAALIGVAAGAGMNNALSVGSLLVLVLSLVMLGASEHRRVWLRDTAGASRVLVLRRRPTPLILEDGSEALHAALLDAARSAVAGYSEDGEEPEEIEILQGRVWRVKVTTVEQVLP